MSFSNLLLPRTLLPRLNAFLKFLHRHRNRIPNINFGDPYPIYLIGRPFRFLGGEGWSSGPGSDEEDSGDEGRLEGDFGGDLDVGSPTASMTDTRHDKHVQIR